MRPRNVVLLAALLALASLPIVASAQETTGTISGRVTDPQGLAVPGVTVTVTGPQGSKTAVTDTDGRYQVPYLVPGSYSVKAELQGFKTVQQSDVLLRLSQTADVPMTMQVGGVTETVDVQGSTPVVDTTSTTIGASLDSALLERVPIGRRFSDTLYIAPGVASGGSVGTANPSVSGASGLDNQYVIDGVNVSNGGYGALGSYSIVFGSLGNGTPYDFMQEVQVKTGGYEAEYGQATGGVINVITKSGSNSLSGSLFGYSRPQQLESDYTQIESPNGTVNTVSTRVSDVGAAIGGPLLRDRVFFFGAIDPSWDRRTMIAPTNRNDDGTLAFPLNALGNVNRERRVLSYAAKGTWQLNANNRFDASFFGDPAKGLMGPQRSSALLATDTSSFSEINKYGGHNQTVRYSGTLTAKWLLEASFARALNEVQETPSVNTWRVTDTRVTPQIVSGGIGFYEAGNKSNNFQYRATATNLVGGHELKYGATYDTLTYDQINQRTGPTFVTPGWRHDRDRRHDPDPARPDLRADLSRDARQPELGAHHQAALRGCVRRGYLEGRQPPDDQAGPPLRAGDARRHVDSGLQAQQELGAARRRHLRSGRQRAQQALWELRDLLPADPERPRCAGTLGGRGNRRRLLRRQPHAADPERCGSRPGWRRRPTTRSRARGRTSSTPTSRSATCRRSSWASSTSWRPTCRLASATCTATSRACSRTSSPSRSSRPTSACPARTASTTSSRTRARAPRPPAASARPSRSRSTTTTRWSSPSTGASPATGRSRRRTGGRACWGTYEGSYRDDNGQSDPGITSLFDFPTNDPSYTAIGVPQFGYQGDIRFLGRAGAGLLPLDRPHQVKVFGSTVLPLGFNVGVGLNLSSGYPLTALAANPNPNYQNGGEIPLTPRGGGFQTVDGFKTRSPFESSVNAHVDWGVRVGGPRRRIVLLADVFNLFNQQRTTGYDSYVETSFGAPNPNFGQRVSAVLGGAPPLIQTPREIRIGARFEF